MPYDASDDFQALTAGYTGGQNAPSASPAPVNLPSFATGNLPQLQVPTAGYGAQGRQAGANGRLNGEMMYHYLTSQGATKNEAALLTSAAHSESGFNPNITHDQGIGYGLFGHNGARLMAMKDFSDKTQQPLQDWRTQAQFALQELRSRPEGELANAAQTPQDLAKAQMFFERPKGFTPQDPTAGLGWSGRLASTQAILNGDFDKLGKGNFVGGQGAASGQSGQPSGPASDNSANPQFSLKETPFADYFNKSADELFSQMDANSGRIAPTQAELNNNATQAIQQAQAQNFGPVTNLGSHLAFQPLLGTGAKIWGGVGAGLQAAKDILAGRPVSNPAYNYQYYNNLYNQSADAYQAQNPLASTVTGLAGDIGAGAAALAPVGSAIGAAADAMPALRPAANFLMGTGGAGAVGELASNAIAGAGQSGVQSLALGQNPLKNTEGEYSWNNPLTTGAALGSTVGSVVRGLTSPLRATALPEVAQAASDMTQAGLEVPGTALIADNGTKQIAQALAGKGALAQVQDLTNKVGQFIGTNGEPLTKPVYEKAVKNIQAGFEKFANTTGIMFDPKAQSDLQQIVADATSGARSIDADRLPAFLDRINKIKSLFNQGNAIITPNAQTIPLMTGSDYQKLTQTGGLIDKMYSDPEFRYFAPQVKDVLDSALARTNPQSAQEIQSLRSQWRVAKGIQPLVEDKLTQNTGLLDPSRFASKFANDDNPVIGTLAKYAAYLPKPDASGAIKDTSGLMRFGLGHFGLGGMTAAGAGIGAVAAEHAMGLYDEAVANPGSATAIGMGALGGLALKHAAAKTLNSPAYTQRIIQNTLNPRATGLFNPLTGLVPAAQEQTGK